MLRGQFVFLGLEVGGKLLWKTFKLPESLAPGLYSIAVHSLQRADCEMLLCGLGAPEKTCPASLCALLRTMAPRTTVVTEYHENTDDSQRRASGSL